ncbi:MAG: hypothetical protein RI906_2988 [Pseudomonadota bacterium]|jgi:NitT/TauT family transport system substrate-binding protein
MRQHRRSFMRGALLSAAATSVLPVTVRAQQVDLTVTHFGTGMYGLPFAVALNKGWFRELAGLEVRGFIGSAGGGATLRNAMASEVPYGEVSLASAIVAIRKGLDIAIIHGGVHSVADQVWVCRRSDATITQYGDLAGRKLAYAGPRSVTDIITSMMLETHGLVGRVERKAMGSMAAGLAALRDGGVDLAYITEPAYSRERYQYRRVWTSADIAPRLVQTVGVVKRDFIEKSPRVLRGILEARRRGVEFIRTRPQDAALIMAGEYSMDETVARAVIDHLLSASGTYWSLGGLDEEGMTVMVKGLERVRAIDPEPVEWGKVTDLRFLAAPVRGAR